MVDFPTVFVRAGWPHALAKFPHDQMDDFSTRSSLERTSPLADDSVSLTLAEIRDSILRLRDEITASIPPNRLTFA
jgi:hypothetical protein